MNNLTSVKYQAGLKNKIFHLLTHVKLTYYHIWLKTNKK